MLCQKLKAGFVQSIPMGLAETPNVVNVPFNATSKVFVFRGGW